MQKCPTYCLTGLQELYAVFRFVKVGSYDGSAPLRQQLQMDQSTIVWTKGQSQVGHMPLQLISCVISCFLSKDTISQPGM